MSEPGDVIEWRSRNIYYRAVRLPHTDPQQFPMWEVTSVWLDGVVVVCEVTEDQLMDWRHRCEGGVRL